MLGHIESYDEECQTGVIKRDHEFYEFHIDQWSSEGAPKTGDDVDFDHEDGQVIDVSLVGAYLVESKPVKSRMVAALLEHKAFLNSPLAILQHLGGFEIAALTAAYISAAQHGLPVLIDGFICSVAALMAVKINPECDGWFFYGHRSEEKGHKIVLQALNARPLLNLNMRLGEASGAVTAVPILQMACRLHNEMATFAQANITTG